MIRVAYVDTSATGRGLKVTGPDGFLEAATIVPYGVQVNVNGREVLLAKDTLAAVGRFFLAASVVCGAELEDLEVVPDGGH